MRALHCTAGFLALALLPVSAAGLRSGPAHQEASPPSQFTVFVRGLPVGTVEVSVERGPNGIVIGGTARLGPPLSVTIKRAEIRYDPEWKPLQYTLDAVIRNQTASVSTTFAGGTATSDVTQAGKSAKKTDTVAPDTLVLPTAFYGAYEALAARLASASPGAELSAYIAPQSEIRIKVIAVSDERIETPGRSLATRRYLVSMMAPAGGTDIQIWADPSGRLVRFSVPTQALDMARTDVATVAARREVGARPGDEDVQIPANGFSLGATVSRNPGTEKPGTVKRPAVVLVSGSSLTNRDETVANIPIYADIAGALADAGFLVVRYDKRGVGESGGRIEAVTVSDYADDADAVVRYVERRKDVDKKCLAVAAHGDGAWTALLAASRDDRIKALALMGGAGSTGAELTLELQQRALARMSITDAEKQERVDLQRRIQKAVITGAGWEDIPPDMRKQADTPWFQSFLLFNPARVVSKTKQPMLIVRGSLDTQMSAAEQEKLVALAKARKGTAGRDVQAGTLAGLNHLFVPAGTGEPDEYTSLQGKRVGQELLDTLTTWLKTTCTALGKR